MGYELIDSAIHDWSRKRSLHVYSTYRDDEVRSVDLVDGNGQKCQIWIDPPNSSGKVHVNVWDYKKRREDFECGIADLFDWLDTAYNTANKWMAIGDK